MSRRRKITSWTVLALYWPLVFASTHIPRPPHLQVYGRDVTLHLLAYLILTLLYWLARYGTTRPDFREGKIYLTLLLMAGYGIIDEVTQELVGRDCDFFDWVSDMSGCLLALALIFLLRRVVYWLIFYWVGLFLLMHWPGKSAFIKLPAFWQQFHIAYVVMGFLVLTLLWWRSMCTEGRFVINKSVILATALCMSSYALFSEAVDLAFNRGFDLPNLFGSLAGVVLGMVCAAALARHRVVQELYQNSQSYL